MVVSLQQKSGSVVFLEELRYHLLLRYGMYGTIPYHTIICTICTILCMVHIVRYLTSVVIEGICSTFYIRKRTLAGRGTR